MSDVQASGGCQCGSVRFKASSLGRASICHCRMCQKAFGSFFGPLVLAGQIEWTRGVPKWFRSSDKGRRGFCEACGTPLCYETGFGQELAIGTFDDPRIAAPVVQVNRREKLAFFDGLAQLPVKKSEPGGEWETFMAGITNHQHPDYDTDQWPCENQMGPEDG